MIRGRTRTEIFPVKHKTHSITSKSPVLEIYQGKITVHMIQNASIQCFHCDVLHVIELILPHYSVNVEDGGDGANLIHHFIHSWVA